MTYSDKSGDLFSANQKDILKFGLTMSWNWTWVKLWLMWKIYFSSNVRKEIRRIVTLQDDSYVKRFLKCQKENNDPCIQLLWVFVCVFILIVHWSIKCISNPPWSHGILEYLIVYRYTLNYCFYWSIFHRMFQIPWAHGGA